jgi:hypothetical protein
MNWDVLQPLVTWLAHSWLGVWLGQSTNRIAWLLTIHLFGLTLLLGATIVANLHLLRLFLRDVPARTVARNVAPVMGIGLALALTSGSLTFIGGAQEYFIGEWFRLKMQLLVVALLFQFTVFRLVMHRAEGTPLVLRMTVGLVGIGIWFGVAFSGRAIAFF